MSTLYDTLCSCISVMFHKGDIVFTIAEELVRKILGIYIRKYGTFKNNSPLITFLVQNPAKVMSIRSSVYSILCYESFPQARQFFLLPEITNTFDILRMW